MTEDELTIVGGVVVSLAACICWVIVASIRSRSRQEHARLRVEVQKSLLGKFDTSQDLASFLASPGSQRFMRDLSLDARGPDVKERILRSVRKGVVLSMIGLAFLILAVPMQEGKVAGLGVFCLAFGLGILAAAAVSHRLGKGWGLIDDPAENSPKNPPGAISRPDDALS